MAGLGSILNTAFKSLEASTMGLSVASNNIANAATPGYSKQRVIFAEAPNIGDKFLSGSGVSVVKIEGLREQLIDGRLQQEISAKAGFEQLADTLGEIEILFNDGGDTGMLPEITDFFNSFHTLAMDPVSTNFREEVRIKADNLAQAFQIRGGALRQLRLTADSGIKNDVAHINTLTSQIGGISTQIIKSEAGGQVANDLRDMRGELVREVSEFLDVLELESSSSYQLHAVGGLMLVLNGTTVPLTANSSSSTGFTEIGIGTADVTSSLKSGRLHARVDVRDKFIPDYLSKLDELAYDITQQVNQIHSASYDASGNTGVDFFTTLGSSADAARLIGLSPTVASDVSTVAASAGAGGTDNQAATAIGNLLHASGTKGSPVDQYRQLVFKLGNDVQTTQGETSEHAALLTQLQNRRDSFAGVSVDEESMQILQFQRSYQASARMIQVIDNLLETLIALGR
jgi:flagellar hook-associated protein 1 FlgK